MEYGSGPPRLGASAAERCDLSIVARSREVSGPSSWPSAMSMASKRFAFSLPFLSIAEPAVTIRG